MLNLLSKRVQWLMQQTGKIVKVQSGSDVYNGLLRCSDIRGLWEVKFCEFSANDISSYGHDAENVPYVILIGE